jgi:hypothetical protein
MKTDQTLLARLLENDLSEAELAELRQALENDPALLADLDTHATLHGWLGLVLEDPNDKEMRVRECLKGAQEADRARFVREVRGKIVKVRFRRSLAWAAAALVVVGVSLWSLIPRPVATVTHITALEGDVAFNEGMKFFKGDHLRLEGGLMELNLAGRGRMIVEGPADLRWSGPMGSTLIKGRVLLRVNERGHGYRLETPKGSLVDLGTEFGVFVDQKSGKVETHVIDGEVEAQPSGGGEPIRLLRNEGLRLSDQQSVRMPADQGAFYGLVPPHHGGDFNMIHWDMEPAADGNVRARTRGLAEDVSILELRNGTQPIEGPFGTAMHFDGKGAYAETSYRGIEGKQPRTVAFWVKVPRDFDPKEGFAMVSWGRFPGEIPGSVWQISINPIEADGPVGRLRVGVMGGKAIGNTDLRDDQWRHIAVVLYPAANPDLGQHVLLYIDGSVETVSRRALGKIDTVVASADHGVWLGRDITSTPGAERHFRGGIDEVHIFDAALSQPEIRALMERNETPGK